MSDPSRESRRKEATTKTFDVLVIGGGIVGMAAARDASFRGYSVLLLEAVDYAFGTSSRSSKFLHGGLRYLEQGDVALVREALLEREIFVRAAPHICRPQRAYVPISPGITRPAWQVRIGLTLYDLLAGKLRRKEGDLFPAHEKISPHSPDSKRLKDLGLAFSDLFAYSDGQMEDTRLVIEHMLDATDLGAVVLNHARVSSLLKDGSVWNISWEDGENGATQLSHARYVVNAGGPWAQEISDSAAPSPIARPLRYSRGTHLLFDVDLGLPGLTISTGARGRVYFVWPYFSPAGKGTLVGTTERETTSNERDPMPAADEIEELFTHLKRDLPNAGLTEKTLYRSFAGMRVLVPRSAKGSETSAISRRECFQEQETLLNILGGKYTTARHTAEQAVDFVDRYFGKKTPRDSREELKLRPLPGGRDANPAVMKATRTALSGAVLAHTPQAKPDEINRVVESAVFRLGTRAKLLLENPEGLIPCSNFSYLAGEAEIARSKEHALTQDDIILRRLLLRSFPLDLDEAKRTLK